MKSIFRSIKHIVPLIVCMTLAQVPQYQFFPLSTAIQTQTVKNENHYKGTLIFDLGGVLLDTSKLKAMWHLGPRLLMSYMKEVGSAHKLKERFYTMLNTITRSNGNTYGSCDYEGYQLPQLMADWLAGKITAQNALRSINDFIRMNPTWFKSNVEQKLMKRMAAMIFSPELLVNMVRMNKAGLALIQEYKKQGYRIIILSNWDPESFALLQEKYPHLFDACDEVIISGHVHDLKPTQTIFAHISSKVPAHTCILIDDQPENIKAARQHGMFAIRCSKKKKTFGYRPNFTLVENKIMAWQQNQNRVSNASEMA